MATNVVNQVAYLRTSREFPEELTQLTVEVNKSYVDVSNAVNTRTIGIFPMNRPAIGGESWYLNGNQKQQNFRQVYPFTTTADIPIGFKIGSISQFTKCSGSFTDGTNWYGAIYATNVAIAGQLTFFIAAVPGNPQSDVIRFLGAPAITKGTIILEWISNP